MIVCFAFACIAARAQEPSHPEPVNQVLRRLEAVRTSGVGRINYFRSSNDLDDEVDFIGATVQVKMQPDLTRTLDGKAEVRLTSPSLGKQGDMRMRILEAYVTKHFSNADLRVGRQIVAWGRADGINPTDNLTPRDFVVLLPFEDDQRFGTTAAKIDAYLSPNRTLTIFATPWFEAAKIPLPTSGPTLVRRMPARTLSNTEIGVKYDKVSDGFDWSLSYYHGFSLLPDLRPVDSLKTGRFVEAYHVRTNVLGADFARNFGRFGFRGEAAYVSTSDRTGRDPHIKNPFLFLVVGVDRTFFDNLNFNLQYFRREVRRYHDSASIADPFARNVARQSAILNGQRTRASDGVSFRVGNKWLHNTLEAEVFGVINFTGKDRFVRPSVTYAINDHLKLTLGANFYHGAPDTQFGGLAPNRGAFAEIRYGL